MQLCGSIKIMTSLLDGAVCAHAALGSGQDMHKQANITCLNKAI